MRGEMSVKIQQVWNSHNTQNRTEYRNMIKRGHQSYWSQELVSWSWFVIVRFRVAEFARTRRAFAEKFGLRQKIWALTYAILSRYYDYDYDYALFGRLRAKKVIFWVFVFFGQEVLYYMVYIAYYAELNLQICNYVQKRRICREIANTRLTKVFVASFALVERLPTSATLSKYSY